jgi:hypothetical protein
LDILLTADFSQQNFFEEVCFNVIAADRKIKFAGIVDAHGKLFFGKYRPDSTNRERSFVVEPSSFYNRYLIPAIHKSEKTPKKRKNTQLNDMSHNPKLEQLRFGLINLCEGTRKLIVIPLDEEGETKRYLCIYILK